MVKAKISLIDDDIKVDDDKVMKEKEGHRKIMYIETPLCFPRLIDSIKKAISIFCFG